MKIANFKFTHIKKSSQEMVGVVDRSSGRVYFAYKEDGEVFSLPEDDFEKRFINL